MIKYVSGYKKTPNFFWLLLCVFLLLFTQTSSAAGNKKKSDSAGTILNYLKDYNVVWQEAGGGPQASMPLGNGDIGLNVWTQQNGDLFFYISKTDAWGTDIRNRDDWNKIGGVLMKLGQIRISMDLPAGILAGSGQASCIQRLQLINGEVVIDRTIGGCGIRQKIWVDANRPVIHIENKCDLAVKWRVKLNDWRLSEGDHLMSRAAQLVWYHQNPENAHPPLDRTLFGAVVKGTGFDNADSEQLVTDRKMNSARISIYAVTAAHTSSPENWYKRVMDSVRQIAAVPYETAYTQHKDWWRKFWLRSWVFTDTDSTAREITKGYVLQRFITACGGRGKYPIKFNGSIFTTGHPNDPDYRAWGGQYWFQNTRAMYWPMLGAGDFDMMMPLFNMYRQMLKGNEALVEKYYHHKGAYFAETAPFWGGLPYMGPEVKENWTGHYFTPVLELSKMMMDYYHYTTDTAFAKNYLIPVAMAGVHFFDEHFPKDDKGELLLDPDNSIEMFWKVHNPAPDIAGLESVLKDLLQLPGSLISNQDLMTCRKLATIIPALPKGENNGAEVLLPYTGAQTAKGRNLENPELYAIYPFRLFGIGMPDLALARRSFRMRAFKDKGCWVQDPIQAAMLGLTDAAKDYVHYNFTRKDPNKKFPAFWDAGHDESPDQDNGGNGQNGLQQMLIQSVGTRIYLLPAWPKDWNVHFKLHAAFNTTVEAELKNGIIQRLKVLPASRRKDIVTSFKVEQH